MSKLGAYAHDIVLARADGRSREGRLLKQMREELIRHLGGSVTPPQRIMIERAAMLQLRCAALDRKVLDGTFTDFDAKTYLAFSNSLTRTLKALGVQPAAPKAPTLADLFPGRNAA